VDDATIVEVRGLHKTYPGATRSAVDGINLSIPRGKIFGLLGPNGAGKTTLLSMLCGLLSPGAGELRISGYDVKTHRTEIKRALGLVPQDLALYPGLSARENLSFFGHMQGLFGEALDARVDACLEIAGLRELAKQRVETFSGGLKRRLNLVIGLIHEPQLLILDEPTVGIDPHSRRFIHDSLSKLNAGGMSIIYTTHYMEEVEQLCDELAIMDHGKIIAQGAVKELLGKYQDGAIEVLASTVLSKKVADDIRALSYISAAHINGKSITLKSEQPHKTIPALLTILQENDVAITSLSLGAVHLEQIFLALTGTRLRD